MSMPVSFSKTPLVLDAISALKVTNYYGVSSLDNVYCYLRIYVRAGALIFSITSFEQQPSGDSRAGLALCFGDQAQYLFLDCNAFGALRARLFSPATDAKDIPAATLASPVPELFRGVDEQGYHWGFSLTLDAAWLQARFDTALTPGNIFLGNVYKFVEGEDAFGSAFPSPQSNGMPCRAGFGEFVVVPY
ncbi:MAG: hypothetical protein RR075_03150 [Pygmaiobacter sp.]